ncbi:Crp/Fnr family transcriptional regulator [Paracoccus sp. EGI L200073]|nr:Crp/Fnr family transcriptional regulator [Paracoccus salsus]
MIHKTGQALDGVQLRRDARVQASLAAALDHTMRVLSKGTILVFEGAKVDSLFHVTSGWLAAAKSLPEGERQIVEFVLPGETYDPTSADGQTSYVELEALCETTVAIIDAATWARLLSELPELRDSERLRDVAARARQSERMLRLGKSSAESRVAYALIEFCMRMTAIGETDRDCVFHVPLGQQQLAEYTGLSSVHVCRTLRRLGRNGLITADDHMDLEIHDVHALAVLAGVDLDALRREIIPGAA